MSKKEIVFSPAFDINKKGMLEPDQTVRYVPEWYKNLSRFEDSNSTKKLSQINDRGTDGSAMGTKMCTAFFDSFNMGYVYLLNDDLHVDIDIDGFPTLSWEGDEMLCDKRPIVDVAVPHQHHPIHFGWRQQWYYDTPKGYSVLITHPLNRHDLPFTTLSGVVDSDVWGLPVFIPFFIKKGFIGTIPKGTPILQMIPIKKDEWTMKVDYSEEKHEINKIKEEKRRLTLFGYYKRNIWTKKKYDK
jgi:hypothetical protein